MKHVMKTMNELIDVIERMQVLLKELQESIFVFVEQCDKNGQVPKDKQH